MKAQDISLFVVATPIGNLEDLSPRARQVLETVQWIAAEDTRHTLNLLRHFGIEKELVSLHEHSSTEKIEALVERLERGERGAYVSDAGTPGISDPGAKLVELVIEKKLMVSPIPGPSAVAALLSVSGFHFSEFHFQGFFPRENKERKEILEKIISQGGVHVFFESPHRAKDFLRSIEDKCPDAELVMGRELTKKFEEVKRGKAKEILSALESREEILGEFVFALELPLQDNSALATIKTEKQMRELLTELHDLGANQKILHATAKSHGWSRSQAYDLTLEILGKKTQ